MPAYIEIRSGWVSFYRQGMSGVGSLLKECYVTTEEGQ